MRKLTRNIISPKLMIAILAAASFVITPVVAQAGGKGEHKKVEKMMKKKVKKMDKITKREAGKPSMSKISKTKKHKE
ncbi:MAG: hypothetical protein GXP02_08580 [Alphaproteobacteria bacterium]|nr:hypothetical protein [Alphaproteobacteria bacterium]